MPDGSTFSPFGVQRWVCSLEVPSHLKAVLYTLALHADRSGQCWLSIDALARGAGLSRRPTQAALRTLEDAGLLARHVTPDRLVNTFVLNLSADGSAVAVRRVRRGAAASSPGMGVGAVGSTPPVLSTAPPPCCGQHPKEEPYEEPYEEPSPDGDGAAPPREAEPLAIEGEVILPDRICDRRTPADLFDAGAEAGRGWGPAMRPAPVDARGQLWGEGLDRLRRITGLPAGRARGLLGRLCKEARDDCAMLSAAIAQAEEDRIGDPVPWLLQAARTRTSGHGLGKLAWLRDEMLAEAGGHWR